MTCPLAVEEYIEMWALFEQFRDKSQWVQYYETVKFLHLPDLKIFVMNLFEDIQVASFIDLVIFFSL